ncbi:LacI family DNA-binding transcriptional regulator [Bradyrhizobium sp. 157]|nr:LacI family DNA-binding transcriptional regulator [Bradyrhizobium sp. 157]
MLIKIHQTPRQALRGPTIRDIAREANVGTATVEGVLKDLGGVRTELAERVIKATKKLNMATGDSGSPRHHSDRGASRSAGGQVFLCRPQRYFPADFGSLDPTILVHRTFVLARTISPASPNTLQSSLFAEQVSSFRLQTIRSSTD